MPWYGVALICWFVVEVVLYAAYAVEHRVVSIRPADAVVVLIVRVLAIWAVIALAHHG